jgi:hypothetical protein
VQERALQAVPDLCESIDYAEVQGVLFPRVAVRANITSLIPPHLTQVLACVYENASIDRQSGDPDNVPEHGEDLRPGVLYPFPVWTLPDVRYVDEFDSETRPVALKNPDEGARCNGAHFPHHAPSAD